MGLLGRQTFKQQDEKIEQVRKDAKSDNKEVKDENLRQWAKIDEMNETLIRVDENVKSIKEAVNKR